ncbi:hypothetical protein GEMRC1_008209 [Eukaryota sp. GEM-RC1]
MRLRLGLFSAELLDNSECICSHRRSATFRHLINCPKFIQFRSVLHNAVKDVTFEMFKAHGFHAKVEPLFSKLGLDLINNSRRGDLHGPFVDSSQIILDVTTVDPCAQTYVNGLNSKGFNHLETAEKRKIDLYSKDVAKLNQNLYLFHLLYLFLVVLVKWLLSFKLILDLCVSLRIIDLTYQFGITV